MRKTIKHAFSMFYTLIKHGFLINQNVRRVLSMLQSLVKHNIITYNNINIIKHNIFKLLNLVLCVLLLVLTRILRVGCGNHIRKLLHFGSGIYI